MEKMNDNDLDAVSGGQTIKSPLSKFVDSIPKSKINCWECGKEMEVINTPISMIDFDGRHAYYSHRCDECALKKPFWKDKVVDNKIIKDGRINELFQKPDYALSSGENNKK